MNCKSATKLTNKALNGLINQSEQALLDRHLTECSRCSEEYTEAMNLDSTLSKALLLQAILGDEFAAKVTERLPDRTSRLLSLKEAIKMSRIKYAMVFIVLLAVAVGVLHPPRSYDVQAFAAAQSAMSKVRSIHYTIETYGVPQAKDSDMEVWSTPEATRTNTPSGGWTIYKQGLVYSHLPELQALFVTAPSGPTMEIMLAGVVDPRAIADTELLESPKVTVRDVEVDNKPMVCIEVEGDRIIPKEQAEATKRIFRKQWEILHTRMKEKKPKRIFVATVSVPDFHLKRIYLVDPSTDLVQSVEDHITAENGSSKYRLVSKIKSIEYNAELPQELFDPSQVPEGTETFYLNEDPEDTRQDEKERL